MSPKTDPEVKMYLYKAAHALLTLIIFFVCWLLYRYEAVVFFVDRFRYNLYILGAFAIVLLLFSRTYNAYLFGYSKIRTLVFTQFISQSFATITVYIGSGLAWNKWSANPAVFVYMLAGLLVLDCGEAYLGTWLYFRLNKRKRALMIYSGQVDLMRMNDMFTPTLRRIYTVEGKICLNGELDYSLLEGYEAIFAAGIEADVRNSIAKYCVEHDISGFFMPHIGDILMQGTQHIQSFNQPMFNLERKRISPEYELAKRAFDIVMSLCGIAVLSPIMLILAALIKLDDGGKVIYRQTRLTRHGREFTIYKFRSMREDAEANGKAVLAADNDPRITHIGRLMRSCRLDELPQLFNILKGDMTIVGPRPERPELAEEIYETLPEFKLRLQVKAGLTGYAQVYGKYNTENYEKLEFDLLYINKMSVRTDLKLMFATFGILFKKESTEGVKRQ